MKSAIIFLYRYQTLQYTYIDTVSSSTYIACINYINVVIVKDTHPRLGNKYNWMQRRKESYLNDLCLQIQSTWILDMYKRV